MVDLLQCYTNEHVVKSKLIIVNSYFLSDNQFIKC